MDQKSNVKEKKRVCPDKTQKGGKYVDTFWVLFPPLATKTLKNEAQVLKTLVLVENECSKDVGVKKPPYVKGKRLK